MKPTERLALQHAAFLTGRASSIGSEWSGDLELAREAILSVLYPNDPRYRDMGQRAIRAEQARTARVGHD